MPNVGVNVNYKLIRDLTIFSTFVALLFSLLLVGTWALDFGVWTRSATLEGPYPADERAFVIDLQSTVPMPAIFDTGGDTSREHSRSNLSLSVDGVVWTRSHVLHAELRAGAKRAFSHWGNSIYFSPGTDAAPPSRIDATYEVRVKPGLKLLLLLGFLLFVPLRVVIALKTGAGMVALRRLVRFWMVGVIWVSWILIAFAIVYFCSIFVAIALGYALPTTAIFRWLPGGDLLDRAMPFAAVPILVVCALGVACGWASLFGVVGTDEVQCLERRLIRIWSYAALPVAVALFVLATGAGGWNGRFVTSGVTYLSIAGLVPHSDAQAYYVSMFDMLNVGSWNELSARRPMAATMRDTFTVGGGMSYVGSILLQAVVVACFVVFAMRSLLIWQGIWAAGAFLALAFGLMQPFLTSTLTEPLGVIWSLLSFAFFIEALRTRSAPHALIGFAALCLALTTRMGSMFTIPFLMIWVFVAFAQTRREALQTGIVLSAIVACVIVLNMTLLALFAPNSELGGNFSYTACGLGRGTDWSECAVTFADQIKELNLADRNSFFYTQAAEAFWRDPSLLLYKVAHNVDLYVTNIPKLLLGQYSSAIDISYRRAALFACLCIPGLMLVMTRRYLVLSFWLTVFVSTVFSAAFVFGDDGTRVLIVTYVFLGGFFALGFTSPVTVRLDAEKKAVDWRYGAASMAAMLMICVGITSALHAYSRLGGGEKDIRSRLTPLVEVTAMPSLTGFLVVADGAKRDPSIRAVEFSEFRKMWELSLLRQEFGPMPVEATKNLPFAFFTAPFASYRSHNSLYFGPPEILTNRNAEKWALELLRLGSDHLLLVKAATISPAKLPEAPAN